jgi:hypothetical protein
MGLVHGSCALSPAFQDSVVLRRSDVGINMVAAVVGDDRDILARRQLADAVHGQMKRLGQLTPLFDQAIGRGRGDHDVCGRQRFL